MEIAYIVLRYLHIHGKFLQPEVIKSIVKAVRVTKLDEYFITQILPCCDYFNMTNARIEAVMNEMKNIAHNIVVEPSPLVPPEWLFPKRDMLDMPRSLRIFRLCSDETQQLDFIQNKNVGTVNLDPQFANFFGVVMESSITFNPPNIVVQVKAVFPLYSINVEKINCDFTCSFSKAERKRKYSGIFSDSVITVSCNILEWQDDNLLNFYEHIKDMHVQFDMKRF